MRDNDWRISDYPLLAGHEGVGVVTQTGPGVRILKHGDRVGIGWIRDSCLTCKYCLAGRENICRNGFQGTYIGKSGGGREGTNEHGGCFVKVMRIEERFAIRIPDEFSDEVACPLLCGGATMYEPICNHAGPAARVGIHGLGGLGRTGLKLAKLRGCHVVVLSSSAHKKELASQAGADEFWITPSSDDDGKQNGDALKDKVPLDLIVDTRPVNADIKGSLDLLDYEGVLCRVGMPNKDDNSLTTSWDPCIFEHKSITGSSVSGTLRLNEMMRLCAPHHEFVVQGGDTFGVEVVPFSDINVAMDKLIKRENKCFRYVLSW